MSVKTGWFEKTTLFQEVLAIFRETRGTFCQMYRGVIHTPEATIGMFDLNNIDQSRDYVNQTADAIRLTCKVGMGEYVKRIYPHRHNLEFTLTRTTIIEGGDSDSDEVPRSVRYKLIFDPSRNPPVGMSDYEQVEINDLNTASIVDLYLELVERSYEPLRIKTTYGTHQGDTVEDIIRSVIGYEASQIQVDGKTPLDAIDIWQPDNTEPVKNLIYGTGTKVLGLPTYLQQTVGVYNYAIGTFYQRYRDKRTLFVYPLYNTERFDNDNYRAVFYCAPQERFPQVDRSFAEDAKVLKVLCTAQRIYTDTGEVSMMNRGSGFRTPEARAYMRKPAVLTENGPMGDRARLNHEVAFKSRDDGLDYVPMSSAGPSANPYYLRSQISLQNVAQVDLLWENGDPELLYPGMPCRAIFVNQGQPTDLKGTIMLVRSSTTKHGVAPGHPYRTAIHVSIATELKKDIPNTAEPGSEGEIFTPGEYLTKAPGTPL